MNLFVYGTLMCADIMAEVTGRELAAGEAATLYGYCRYRVTGEDYPALVPAEAEASVAGLVFRAIPDDAWPRLDDFEGEQYERRCVRVVLADSSEIEAETYVLHPACRDQVQSQPWDFDEFLREGKVRFCRSYRGYGSLDA